MRWRPIWTDLALTAVLAVVGVFGTAGAAHNQNTTAPVFAYVLAVAAAAPILAWRRRPLWTYAVTSALAVLYLALLYPYGPILITLGVVVVGTALRLPVRRSVASFLILLAVVDLVIGIGVLSGDRAATELLSSAAWLVVPAAVGLTLRIRRDAARDIHAEQARRAVSEERLHLAREVHDVAGHGFAVIAMQAGIALRVLDRDRAAARAALEGIRATSRAALDSLRSDVTALQGADAPLRPTPGLADLPVLAERIRSSGVPVAIEGLTAGDVSAEVDHAAYRIVQESLTNVLRHGGAAATARVTVRREMRGLTITVSSTGGGSAVRAAGHGIAGMRTRAEGLGGTLEAGPSPQGFEVRAFLPLNGGAS